LMLVAQFISFRDNLIIGNQLFYGGSIGTQ
jgi:hypothetical protein